MLTTVTEDIQKIVITFPGGMKHVNSYIIKGSKGYTIIDTGMNHEEGKSIWESFLSRGEKIEKIVLTHIHEDHIGLAKWFQQEKGIPVYVSDIGYREMKTNLDLSFGHFKQFIMKHGGPQLPETWPLDFSIYNFEPDGVFTEGESIFLGDHYFRAIWTPGHAPDQFCFYSDEKKLMIVGDHILKDVAPVIGLWNGKEANPLQEYLDSLEKIKSYSTELALPGHGDIIDDFYNRIEELKERHHCRLDQVYQLLGNGPKTAYQICLEIYGKVNIIMQLSSFMATLTRLLYLESIGKVYRTETDGKVFFTSSEVL